MANDVSPAFLAQQWFEQTNSDTVRLKSGKTIAMLASTFQVQDATDTTKIGVFSASGITTATTRTYTLPDQSTTLLGRAMLAGSATAGSWPTLASGTILGTVEAGAQEFDGVVPYFSPAALHRAVNLLGYFSQVVSTTSLSNSATTVQNIFAATNDVVTVRASTTYLVDAVIKLTTGATSHTTAFGFDGTGAATATATAVMLESWATSAAATTLATPQMREIVSLTSAVVTAASTSVVTNLVVRGFITIGTGGTIAPCVTFSAGPTGTCTVDVGSYMMLIPLGTSTALSVGAWA